MGILGAPATTRLAALLRQAQVLGLRAKVRLADKHFDAAIKDVVRAASYANVLLGPFVDEA